MATSLTQYGITWTWVEDLTTGQFANGDYYVVAPLGLTLSGISPASTVTGTSRTINGSMVNPAPANYASQGFDTTLLNYSESLNIARKSGAILSAGNTRSIAAGSSIVSTISSEEDNRNTVRQCFTDMAVLTVLVAEPAAGSLRPPYTGTDKTIRWNKSDLDYSILKNLDPVAGMNSPTSTAFTRPWMAIELDYNQARHWAPINNQPEYDTDMALATAQALLELHTNYSNATKEAAYIRLVQQGIDYHNEADIGTWTEGGTPYHGLHGNTHAKPLVVLAALALDDEGLKTICDGSVHVVNPFSWDGSQPIFYSDTQVWYVAAEDVGRALDAGHVEYTSGDIGIPEWGQEHWGSRVKDDAAWGALYRNVRYPGQAGMSLAMQLTTGARLLWNNQVWFDYFDRAFAIYTATPGTDPTPDYVQLFWEANRSLGGPVWTGSPDTTPATLSSATIQSAGTSILLAFSEAVIRTAGTPTVSLSGGAVTLTYVSGSGTNSHVYSLSRTVFYDETGALSVTLSEGNWIDASANSMTTVSGLTVTNNSTHGESPPPATTTFSDLTVTVLRFA